MLLSRASLGYAYVGCCAASLALLSGLKPLGTALQHRSKQQPILQHRGFSMETPKSINEHVVDTFTPLGYAFPSEPTSGDLVVGPDEVMHSAAGYYIGQHCFEFLDDGELYHGEWTGPMPYDRNTMYMSREQAELFLKLYPSEDDV
jgi:hypothetical protein